MIPGWIIRSTVFLYTWTYTYWQPIEKALSNIRNWIQMYIPSYIVSIVHISRDGNVKVLYRNSFWYLSSTVSWKLTENPHLFIFKIWNTKTKNIECYCLSTTQLKSAFGLIFDSTLNHLTHFERNYFINTIANYVLQFDKAPALTVIPYKKYCRGLEPYASTVMGVQNLTVYQLCQLASFVMRTPQPKREESCEAMIIDEHLKETIKYGHHLLFEKEIQIDSP
jgi:hypothetical protein